MDLLIMHVGASSLNHSNYKIIYMNKLAIWIQHKYVKCFAKCSRPIILEFCLKPLLYTHRAPLNIFMQLKVEL